MAKATGETIRQELTALLHAVIDASGYEQAEQALAQLKAHPFGGPLAKKVNEQFDRLLYPLLACHQGLVRIAPEWLWRDFRLRLSRGRNHGSEDRFERAGLLWAIYHNFTPAQRRRERKRHYKHPGQSPLEVAGGEPRGDQLPGRPELYERSRLACPCPQIEGGRQAGRGGSRCPPAGPISHQQNLQPSQAQAVAF